ncbi:MAG TPA: hypothetical protein VNT75_18800 [Symbiobacteriaceae bacterium]|nr:hypothetical protein [Symbiobacteriaceae bacterium]
MPVPLRYTKMKIGPMGTVHLHRRNPWMALACSVAMPGLGHFYCGAYLRGAILMVWEIALNQYGRVNSAILLSAMGHNLEAQAVVRYQWALMYPLFYVLAMWDSYRLAADLNHVAELERRQPRHTFHALSLTLGEVNYMGRRNPWVAAFLSLVLAGAGHLYNFQLIKALVLMGWHIAIWLNSGLNSALIATLHGEWHAVHRLIDYQWLLFLPSIHVFNVWNAYHDAIELNNLYEEGVTHFLREVTAGARADSDASRMPAPADGV